MKTCMKLMTTAFAIGISAVSFGQINLGLQSTTQAAVKATAATQGVVKATTISTQATKSVVNAGIEKTGVAAKNEVKKSANLDATVSTDAEIGSTTQLQHNSNATNNSAQSNAGVDGKATAETETEISVNGKPVMDNVEQASGKLSAKAEKTKDAAVQTTREVKGKVKNEVKSVKDKAASVESNTALAAEASASGSTNVKGQ